MADRRTALLDAALELVGTEGMRGLTHRAVDLAAAVPPGSTSNYFRTREALILGIVERFIVREREMATGPYDEVEPSPEGVAAAFGRFVHRAVGPDRAVTLARYAILVETAQNPERGTAEALLLLLYGRSPRRDELVGPGAQVLAARL